MNDLNRKEDIYWTVKEIRPHIINYLKKIFPGSIIDREFSRVDLMVLGPNVPVEIQKTRLCNDGCASISGFEDEIRRQIEQNISIFGRCWFFFDAKFLYHLQNDLARNTSINMDWLYQFFKSGKLKVFVISLAEDPRELEDKDFEFIRKFSSTCILGDGDINRILEKNKSKIAYNVYKGYGFTTEETKKLYDEYENDNDKNKRGFVQWLRKKDGRYTELGNIKYVLNQLLHINHMLRCNMQDRHAIQYASILGIVEGNENMMGGNIKFSRIMCIDKYDILKYFPGYFEKKDLWDFWNVHMVSHRIFMAVARGEYPNYLRDYKNQKSIEDAWG